MGRQTAVLRIAADRGTSGGGGPGCWRPHRSGRCRGEVLSTEAFGEEGVDALGLGALVAVAAEPAERVVDCAGLLWLTVAREVLLDGLGCERLGGDSGARCSAFESS